MQHILASTSPSGRSVVWDLRKNEPIIQVADSSSRIQCSAMAWHPDVATQLVTSSIDDRSPVIQVQGICRCRNEVPSPPRKNPVPISLSFFFFSFNFFFLLGINYSPLRSVRVICYPLSVYCAVYRCGICAMPLLPCALWSVISEASCRWPGVPRTLTSCCQPPRTTVCSAGTPTVKFLEER